MAREDIQMVDFMKQSNQYIDYENININDLENRLENDNLNPIERRKLEAIHKNCMLLKQNSFNEKTRFLSEETRSELRQKRIDDMKKEKDRALHFKKLVIRAGIVTLLAASAGVGIKIYHDTQVKPIKIINEKYDKVYSNLTIEKGQTLTDIARKLYDTYPEDVKKIKKINDLIDEIVQINHIKDPNNIVSGQNLIIPIEYVEPDNEINENKIY